MTREGGKERAWASRAQDVLPLNTKEDQDGRATRTGARASL